MRCRSLLRFAALSLLAACWTGSTPVPPPAPSSHVASAVTPPPSPGFASAEFGRWDALTGAFTPTLEIPLVPGLLFGWRLQTGCREEMVIVDEEIRTPSAGDWNDPDITVNADQTLARVHAEAVCGSSGQLDKQWAVSALDPAGDWVFRVRVAGYGQATFRPTFTQPGP